MQKKYEKIDFKMPNGTIVKLTKILRPKKKFVAESPPFGGYFGLENIKICPLFYRFSYKEQVAIIYHELWHRKNNELFEIKLLFSFKPWRLFRYRWISHQQEFQADLQGARLGGKKTMLAVLRKLKRILKMGLIDISHEKSHPLIDDRIRNIEKLKSRKRRS